MKTKLWSFICILSLLLVPSCAPDNTQPENPQLTGDPPVIVNESLPTITNTTLSMNITVNPGNLPTTVRIQYGETTSYNKEAFSTQSPVSGNANISVDAAISGLKSGQSYHYRLKVTNSEGTAYGEDRVFSTTVTDIDQNTYNIVTFGTQTWMVENLKTTRYRNGDLIGTSNPPNLDLRGHTDPKYQWAPAGIEENVAVFGRLYTWYAANDTRNICPEGWHIPTDDEWTILENFLIASGYNYDGSTTGYKVAKALSSAVYWDYSSIIGSAGNTDFTEKRNATGFTALPAGYRDYFGPFSTIGGSTFWWTSTEVLSSTAYYRAIQSNYEFISRNGYNKQDGFSVRCIRD
jgi:uncharacterized protein (TIGR02145 family)